MEKSDSMQWMIALVAIVAIVSIVTMTWLGRGSSAPSAVPSSIDGPSGTLGGQAYAKPSRASTILQCGDGSAALVSVQNGNCTSSPSQATCAGGWYDYAIANCFSQSVYCTNTSGTGACTLL